MDTIDERSGILVLDKPAGISSARALGRVRKKTGARKAGHAGTLDPFATGVLVCCLNKATRLAPFFTAGPKTYEAELLLGIATDTQDGTGRVISTGDAQDIAEADIRRTFDVYIGEIEQSPPVFSALKSDGVPLYRLARAGNPIQKPPRKRFIYDSRILAIDLPRIRFQVTCSAGTYIRSLGADIGADLGCGGHLHALRRIGSGGFSLEDALAWEMFEGEGGEEAIRAGIIGMADALRCMPACRADERLAEKIRHGKRLSAEDLCVDYPGGGDAGGGDPHIKIVDGQNSLLAVVKKTPEEGLVDYCCVFSSD